ncbi:Mobile element protein, partial [hydrothermal vent metagenome]
MARFKDYNYDQDKLLPIRFDRQSLPGSFEYNLSYLVEHELDLSIFEHRYHNDETGRPAYDPAILLKIIILAYARGVTTSRKIERLCRENVTFMAISADSQPHYTTLADFVSSSSEQIQQLFVQVLLICDAEGLIGRDMFAIDGCKLPGNASKEWSGTRAELKKKKRKLDKAARYILNKHRTSDQQEQDPDIQEREAQQRKKLRCASRKIQQFLDSHEERTGVSGKPVKSNITDPESAK